MASAAPVTVVLDGAGHVEGVDGDRVVIPAFGGGRRVWNAVVSCVRAKFAAFAVDVVDERPADGTYITAVVGGGAELLGLDPDHVAGIGPSDGEVIPDAVVHIFSRTIGETDVQDLCETSAHEIGHALGLDHSMQCGDLMSYPRDECGNHPTLTFLDANARCGEFEGRDCENGDATQNSFEKLARLVGLRNDDAEPAVDAPPPEPMPEAAPEASPDPSPEASFEAPVDSAPEHVAPARSCQHVIVERHVVIEQHVRLRHRRRHGHRR